MLPSPATEQGVLFCRALRFQPRGNPINAPAIRFMEPASHLAIYLPPPSGRTAQKPLRKPEKRDIANELFEPPAKTRGA